MFKSLLTIPLFLCSLALFGQQTDTYTLKGTVHDSRSKTPVEFATVALTKASDQQLVSATTTDKFGAFEFKRVPQEDLVMTVSYMGYKNLQKNISSTTEAVVDLGEIALEEDATRLSDVVVEAIGNPIVFKKDTIEYTASSYKVAENAVLEDLIKKLPGAEVDSDGKITVHGKEISKITVDGQTFFADDPTIASKNLPAKMVDKVQVVDRKSDQAQFTGIDDGNEETVLNLTVMPGMKNGWLGNLSAGAGHRGRYQAGGFVARFDNNWQLSFIGSGNNTNNRGFTDIAGSMMQSGRSGTGGGGGGGRMMMGGGPGGAQGGFNLNVGGMNMNIGGNGITTSWLTGLNAHLQANKNLKIGGNYFYSGSDSKLEQERVRENIMTDPNDNFFYNQTSLSTNKTQGHRAALEFEYTLDSLNSFIFKPNFGLGYGEFNESSSYTSILTNGTDINNGYNASTGTNDNLSASGDLLWRRKLNIPGRTFSANLNYGYNKNNTDGRNESFTRDYTTITPKDSVIHQKYNTKSDGYNIGTRLSYTEPLGKGYYMELAYSFRYNNSSSDKETRNVADNQIDLRYSNNYDNIFINHSGEVNLRGVGEKYNYIIGVNVQPSYMNSKYVSNGTPYEFSRSVVNFAPNAQFIYNYSDFEQLRINYRGSTRQPSMSQLQPVMDNADPLYVNIGNPDLNPEFQHNLFGMYRLTNTKSYFTLMTFFSANYAFDRIVNASIYDDARRQTVIPVNTDGVYSANVRLMINTPLTKNSKFFITSNSGVNFNQTVSYTGQVPDIIGLDREDLLNLTERSNTQNLNLNEMLRLNYRGSKFDAGISARANWTQAWYSIDNRAGTNYWSNAVGADFNWTLPWDFNLISDVNHNYYIGYSSGNDKPMTIWNAEVTKQVFKSKQGTISVKVFDILNDSRGTRRNTTNNYIEEVVSNTLGRYVMFSFTYRFGSIGGQRTSFMPGGDGIRIQRGPGGREGSGGGAPRVQIMEVPR
ncbi:MAG: outer membrane beta-barrel protein [Bacteroidales bacterium]|nr:outer membrane beta-barrel protein [Bacteroidales bacterium]